MAKVKNMKARKRLDAVISQLVLFRPLYGTVFLFLNKIESTEVKTMAVGTTRRVDLALYYNPEFTEKLTYDELRAVLIHEALHVLLHHIARANHFGYSMKNFNITADMAINCNITNLPDGALYPSTFNLPDHQSAEWYYEKLKKEAEKQGADGVGELAEGKGDLVDDHSMWGDADEEIIKEKSRAISKKAIKAQEKQGWGDIPSNIAQQVIALSKAQKNWKRELRYFVNRTILMSRKPSRQRLNRRFSSRKKLRYLYPGTRKDHMAKILVAMDTSASVSDDELQQFVTELSGMQENAEIHAVCFDTKLHGEPKLLDRKVLKFDIKGRGGTDFTEPLALADEGGYHSVIIMSDLECYFPDKPRARVMWVGTSSADGKIMPPYGKTIYLTKN